jgi:predicted DNA-binding ribbon-helix-helix protein
MKRFWRYQQSVNKPPKARRKKSRDNGMHSVRASISFPSELYKTLEQIAKQKKVSLAWVVREAVEQYLADKWPLFARDRQNQALNANVLR